MQLDGWKKVKLGDAAEEIRKLFEPSKESVRPYVGLEHIAQNNLKLNGVGKSTDTISTKKKFEEGDILFGSLRPYFRKVVRPRFRGVCSTDITVIKSKTGFDICYLFYLIASQNFTDHASNVSSGTRMPRASWKVLKETEWNFPPDIVQRKIAAVLSAYDDLIENNLQRIKILEEMAQNLYCEWFVNFRFSGHENTRFVDSPLGKIPEGWKVTLLENACERITDGAHRSPKTTLQGYPMASVKDMHNWGINIETCRKISEEDFLELTQTDCVMRKGDVLIAKDGSYLKHSIEVEKDYDIALLSSIAILRSNKKISPTFLLMTLKDENTISRLKGYVSGAALPRIILKEFRKFPIIMPPSNIHNKFVNIVEPLQRLCWRLVEKNKLLHQTRDFLLPKLISGEVDVSELDIKVLEEAVV